jgi:transcriptional regulator with XRE-family HTH domain
MFREIVNKALQHAGNQENLATKMDLSPSALSKKLKGETGWNETDIDNLFEVSQFCTSCSDSHTKELDAMFETLRVVLHRRKEGAQ